MKLKNVLSKVILVCVLVFVPFVSYGADDTGVLDVYQNALSNIAEKSKLAVVHITPSSEKVVVKDTEKSSKDQGGSGSGVLISQDGLIVTNNHVVGDAKEVDITLSNEDVYTGKVLGRDKGTDLAVVKIEMVDGEMFPFLNLGDSDKLKIGFLAIAIGNPFDLEGTVTVGVISALHRDYLSLAKYTDFLQTDAAINPGNSGGALVNSKGELVGINTAIINYASGIGFSVPSNTLKRIVPELVSTGKITRGWLGIAIQDLSVDVAEKFNVEVHSGVLINEVMEGSPAEKAKLKVGDILTKIDDTEIKFGTQIIKLVGNMPINKEVKLTIIRDGKTITVKVILTEKKEE
jgi:serine protease Do